MTEEKLAWLHMDMAGAVGRIMVEWRQERGRRWVRAFKYGKWKFGESGHWIDTRSSIWSESLWVIGRIGRGDWGGEIGVSGLRTSSIQGLGAGSVQYIL